MDLPHDKQFHFKDGTAVGSLDGLTAYLERIGYEEFYHHVNAEKNDFASWIRHILKEEQLSNDLEKVSSIVETVEILNDYLHPRVPEASHEDIQSKIEEEQGIEPPMHVEEVPAAQADQISSIEEKILKPADIEAMTEPEEEAQPLPEEKPDVKPGMTPHDRKMLIVKDFLWGFLFGVIVGVILGKMISII